jgi:lipid II:glycine glycyltransferase (peptidoglycan interpeptide bridge formation enzyme)
MDRKRFVEFNDPAYCRAVQRELPPSRKLRVFLCKSNEGLCHGAIGSTFGDTGMSLFGATSNRGRQYNTSYLIQWRMLEWMKSQGCQFNDLNGINPISNPSLFEFKSGLAGAHGHDVHLLGAFDGYPNTTTKLLLPPADLLRRSLMTARARLSLLMASKRIS